MIRRTSQTKIVATIGPASESPEMLESLFLKGVDIFRLNFSHDSKEGHQRRFNLIRSLEEKHNRPIAIIADMQGPKLRIGKFAKGLIPLENGQIIKMDLNTDDGDETRVNLPHPEVIEVLNEGDHILLDDGNVRVEVQEKGNDYLVTRVIAGRKLSNNKGFNIPGVILPIPALTEKDKIDLETALEMKADWIAQSFVQQKSDVEEAKKIIGDRASLIVKIEKPSALEHIEEIIELTDGVMVARGDLGVEIPPENVPSVQKKIVRMARHAGKPVIVATQMLESMIENPRPTRAEASDVATAVYDGADAVMLSAETAVGKYPEEAVMMMDRICSRTESDETYRQIIESDHPGYDGVISDSITTAACNVAEKIGASCIVNFTRNGTTTVRTSRHRPKVPILCLAENINVARKLSVMYGVHAVKVDTLKNFGEAVSAASEQALLHKLAKAGDRIIITAGVPFGTPLATNTLRVTEILK